MPLINVRLIEDVFDAAQKREIVEKLTEAMVSIEGENMRPVTWCVVEEVRSGDGGGDLASRVRVLQAHRLKLRGIGGNPLTTADVRKLAAGQPAMT